MDRSVLFRNRSYGPIGTIHKCSAENRPRCHACGDTIFFQEVSWLVHCIAFLLHACHTTSQGALWNNFLVKSVWFIDSLFDCMARDID